MLTIDSSVWINADSPNEAGHAFSRSLLDRVADDNLTIIVPTLLQVETAGAISRVKKDKLEAANYAEAMAALPFIRWISLDEKLAASAAILAAAHSLRGADAVYAAVAIEFGCTLVSLDKEHLTHLVGVLDVLSPENAMSQL